MKTEPPIETSATMTTQPTPIDVPEAIELIPAGIIGHAVGDALGVSVEFRSRDFLDAHPVTGMQGYGTHHQPPGTWSDDTSLSLCLADSLCGGYDLADQARRFIAWMDEDLWTAHGEVFDIGGTTAEAIGRLSELLGEGGDVRLAGPRGQYNNGNGSLMRLLPLAMYDAALPPADRINRAMDASCLTHGHPRSQIACAFYAELVAWLMRGAPMDHALAKTQALFTTFIEAEFPDERIAFSRTLDPHLAEYDREDISGSGYVVHCLDASIWCNLNANTYAQAVLAAVNLGEDTDTTGAVTGGLAGLRFGLGGIPDHWRYQLARHDDIEALGDSFASACRDHWENQSHPSI